MKWLQLPKLRIDGKWILSGKARYFRGHFVPRKKRLLTIYAKNGVAGESCLFRPLGVIKHR